MNKYTGAMGVGTAVIVALSMMYIVTQDTETVYHSDILAFFDENPGINTFLKHQPNKGEVNMAIRYGESYKRYRLTEENEFCQYDGYYKEACYKLYVEYFPAQWIIERYNYDYTSHYLLRKRTLVTIDSGFDENCVWAIRRTPYYATKALNGDGGYLEETITACKINDNIETNIKTRFVPASTSKIHRVVMRVDNLETPNIPFDYGDKTRVGFILNDTQYYFQWDGARDNFDYAELDKSERVLINFKKQNGEIKVGQ